MVKKVSDIHYKLVSEVYELKKDFAFKQEELQAMYIENKSLNNKIKLLEKENHSFKQQIKQLEEEQEDLLKHPIHRKYNKLVLKIVSIIFIIFISISLMSCDRLEFDPTTSVIKYIIKEKKNEQSIK